MLKKANALLLGLLLSTSLWSPPALATAIPLYPPSFSNGVLDVTILNQLITAVNNITGGGTSGPIAATTLSASGAVSGAGFTALFASPPAIGGTAPAAGAFTTLSASSTVSGTGFTTRLASPGPIGNTVASTGAFTTLSATGAFTASPANLNDVLSPTGTGVVTINPATLGTIDNMTLGGTTPAAGHVTTLSTNGLTSFGSTTPVHIVAGQTTPPTLTTCGTGAVVGNATDIAGEVHATGATACTVSWTGTFTSQPYCTAVDNTTAAGLKLLYVSTTGFTVSGLTSGDTFSYTCIGQAGG